MTQWVMCSPGKHENLGSIPRTHVKSREAISHMFIISEPERLQQEDPGTCSDANQTESVSSRYGKRPCLKKKKKSGKAGSD